MGAGSPLTPPLIEIGQVITHAYFNRFKEIVFPAYKVGYLLIPTELPVTEDPERFLGDISKDLSQKYEIVAINDPRLVLEPVDVFIQDQISPPIIVKFKKEIARTVSTVITTININTITVASVTGFDIGKYITVLNSTAVRFYLATVIAINGNVITLDSPFDHAYPVGSVVTVSDTNMAVDGSETIQVFNIRDDVGAIDVAYDVTRIMIAGLCVTAPDLSKFGDLTKLTYGIILRIVDGFKQNVFNVKSNSEMKNIMYDFDLTFADNPSHGQNGFNGRLTFAGQNKMGVAIRLAPGDNLEILIQDNLIGLTSLEIITEGHLVVD